MNFIRRCWKSIKNRFPQQRRGKYEWNRTLNYPLLARTYKCEDYEGIKSLGSPYIVPRNVTYETSLPNGKGRTTAIYLHYMDGDGSLNKAEKIENTWGTFWVIGDLNRIVKYVPSDYAQNYTDLYHHTLYCSRLQEAQWYAILAFLLIKNYTTNR